MNWRSKHKHIKSQEMLRRELPDTTRNDDFVEKLKCVHEGLAELSFLVDQCTEEGGKPKRLQKGE